jgi:phage tail-like protein
MPDVLLRSFRFRVRLLRSSAINGSDGHTRGSVTGTPPNGEPFGDGAFAECTGLDLEMEVKDHAEGGRNDGVIRLVGRARYQPIVLRRGMFLPQGGALNRDLWDWLQGIVSGRRPVARYDGLVEVLDRDTVVARWAFLRGVPSKLAGPALNARTGEVAIEEISIAHEGLQLVSPS